MTTPTTTKRTKCPNPEAPPLLANFDRGSTMIYCTNPTRGAEVDMGGNQGDKDEDGAEVTTT